MNIKNKGFTLVELLAVITILGLIALIAVPTVLNNIKTTKEDLYNTQIELIKAGALSYVTDAIAHPNINQSISDMAKSHTPQIITISLDQLQISGAVEADVMNPFCDSEDKYFSPELTKIEIKYDGKEFEYDVYYETSNYNERYERLKTSCVAKRDKTNE